jgi:hypothetical protein
VLCGRLAGVVLALLLGLAASAEEQPDYFRPEPFELRKHAELELRQDLFDYDILDVVARFSYDGAVEVELVADACRNLAADEGKNGLWLALVVDGATWAPAQLEYLYVWVDRDATVAAYPADDFLWTTGWEGHAADLGVRLGTHAAVHVIGQLQRFKDAPRVEARDDWVGRLRLALRLGL